MQGRNFPEDRYHRHNELELQNIPATKRELQRTICIKAHDFYPSSLNQATQLVKIDPQNIEYNHIQAQIISINDPQKGRYLLENLLSLSKTQYLNIRADYAYTLMKTQQNHEASERVLSESHKMDPKHCGTLLAYGELLSKLGKHQKALEMFNNFLKYENGWDKSNNWPWFYYLISKSYFCENRFHEAKRCLRRLVFD